MFAIMIGNVIFMVPKSPPPPSVILYTILKPYWSVPSRADLSWTYSSGSRLILFGPLQMGTVTKILIKMRPLSTDGAILILVLIVHQYVNLRNSANL